VSPTKQKQLDAYLRAGLTEPFAKAILDGIDPKEVLELWEQDWWKQYEANDQLVSATLSGKLPQSDAKWLNEIRSDHQGLVSKCLDNEVSLEWARIIMDTGFKQDPDAVEMVLDGAIPSVIAKLRKIADGENIPPMIPALPKFTPATQFRMNSKLVDRLARFVDEETIREIFIDLYGVNGTSRWGDFNLNEMLEFADKEGKITGDDRSSDQSLRFKKKRARAEEWFHQRFLLIKPNDG